MSPPSLTELATSSAQDPSPSGDTTTEEYEAFDVSGLPFVKRHPTTAIGGTATALRYFPDEDEPDRGYAGLVLTDPFLGEVDGRQRVAVRDDAEKSKGDDIKLVDLDDPTTKAMPGNVGVEFDSRSFYSELFESWPDTETAQDLLDEDLDITQPVVKLTGSSGRSAIRTLDVHGRGNASAVRDENGEFKLNDSGWPIMNDALIQTHPDWYDDDVSDAPAPRFAPAQTQLRPDVEGTRVVVLLQRTSDVIEDYEGDAYWETVFAELDADRRDELAAEYARRHNEDADEGEPTKEPSDYVTEVTVEDGSTVEMVKLEPTAEFERSEAIKRDRNTYVEDDWGHWPSTEELNELRQENGFDEISSS